MTQMRWQVLAILWAILACICKLNTANPIRKSASFVVPTYGAIDSLSLSTYLTDAADLHYAAVLSGHSPLEASAIKSASQQCQAVPKGAVSPNDGNAIVHANTVEIRKAQKVESFVRGLAPNTSYDVYFVAEVPKSNGVYGPVLSVLGTMTHAKPPVLSNVLVRPSNASAHSIVINGTLSTLGTTFIALVPSHKLLSELSVQQIVKGTTNSQAQGLVFDSYTPSTLSFQWTITGLESATEYDLFIVTEGMDRGGVYSESTHLPRAIRTHATPPTVWLHSCAACNGKSTDITVSFQLVFLPEDLNRVTNETRLQYGVRVHYQVQSMEIKEFSDLHGEFLVANDPQSVDELVQITSAIHTHTITGLEAGTSYNVSLVAETMGSYGLMGANQTVHACKTHALAPIIHKANATATNQTVRGVTLHVELEHAGNVHYVVGRRSLHTLRSSFQQATSVENLIQLVSEREREDPQLITGVVESTQLSAFNSSDKTFAGCFRIDGLEDGTAYSIVLFPETSASFGVFGTPYPEALEVITNAHASLVTLHRAIPSYGSLSSMDVHVEMSKPSDILFYCLTTSLEAYSMDCVEVSQVELGRDSVTSTNMTFVIGNLTEDSIFYLQLYAESEQRNGVISDRTMPLARVQTHRAAGQLVDLSTFPIAAKTDTIVVIARIEEPCRLHYAIQERRVAKDSNSTLEAEPLTASTITSTSTQTTPTSVTIGRIVKRGSLDVNTHVVDFVVGELEPNTTYVVHAVTETRVAMEEAVSSGVYGDVVISNTTTHDIAPTIIKATAGASPNTTDSIFLTANVSMPGIVHYHLSDIDFAAPSILKTPANKSHVHPYLHPHVVRGSFRIYASDLVMEIINGTNDSKPMDPLQFASNTTVYGLKSGTTYHVSLTTETFDSDGVFGPFPPPILVTTHIAAPTLGHKLHVGPDPDSSTSLSFEFQLDKLGDVHYALFFRGLVDDRSSAYYEAQREQARAEHAAVLGAEKAAREAAGNFTNVTETFPPRWPPASSTFDVTQLTARALKDAKLEELGEGVWVNGTVSVSREDVLKRKYTDKTFDKLPSNAVFELCLVTETAASDGIFGWTPGQSFCHRLQTHADYSNQSIMFDEINVRPLDGETEGIHIMLNMSKLLVAPSDTSSIIDAQERLAVAAGRIPYYILVDGKEGRLDFSHNSFSDRSHRPGQRKANENGRSPFKAAVVGRANVVSTGTFTHVTSENETFLTVEHDIRGLVANRAYYLFFAYETIGSDGVFTKVNPHKHRPNDTRSENEGIEVTTHEEAPRLTRYEATPMYGSTTSVSVNLDIACSSCSSALAHVLVYPTHCPTPSIEALQKQRNVTEEVGDCTSPLARERIVVTMPDRQTSSNRVTADISNGLAPNTTYAVYIATETANSSGVFSPRFVSMAVTTLAPAPAFKHLTFRPRRGSTTEFMLEFELEREGEVHYMLGKSGNAEFNATSPFNVSNKALPGSDKHKQHKAHEYARDIVRLRRSVDVEHADERYVEVLDYLDAGTAYDLFIVVETMDDKGIYGEIQSFVNVSTYSNAPILLLHSAYPTPGTTSSLTVGFRVDGPGLVHFAATTSTLWTTTKHVPTTQSDVYGNRLAMQDRLVQQVTMRIDETMMQRIGGTWDSGWREVNISVPISGTNYSIHLVTETEGSEGVYGSVASHHHVQSHAKAPTLHNITLAPADARVDALTTSVVVSGPAHIHYVALRHGQPFTSNAHAAASGVVVVNGTTLSTVILIEGLRERTLYDVYLRAETLNSGGVLGEWTSMPVSARTHGLPAEVLEDLECQVMPTCESIGREPCTQTPNVCGECVDGYSSSVEGSSNEPCSPYASVLQDPNQPQIKRAINPTIRINGVRIYRQPGTEESHESTSSTLNEQTPVDGEVSDISACPLNAVLVEAGHCECDAGYEVDEAGMLCVLENPRTESLTHSTMGMESTFSV